MQFMVFSLLLESGAEQREHPPHEPLLASRNRFAWRLPVGDRTRPPIGASPLRDSAGFKPASLPTANPYPTTAPKPRCNIGDNHAAAARIEAMIAEREQAIERGQFVPRFGAQAEIAQRA